MFEAKSMDDVKGILLLDGNIMRLNAVFGVTDLNFYKNKAVKECWGNGGIVAVSKEQEVALREIIAEVIPEYVLSRLRLEIRDTDDTVVQWNSSGRPTAWSLDPGVHKRTLSLLMLGFSRERDYFYEGTLVEVDLFRYNVCAAF